MKKKVSSTRPIGEIREKEKSFNKPIWQQNPRGIDNWEEEPVSKSTDQSFCQGVTSPPKEGGVEPAK